MYLVGRWVEGALVVLPEALEGRLHVLPDLVQARHVQADLTFGPNLWSEPKFMYEKQAISLHNNNFGTN